MDNSRFSSLVYRIIGKPELWHNDYIDVMHQILDETDSFDDPENFSELAFGDQILSRMRDSNETLAAFSTLLDKSRFKMIILDEHFTPIYNNQNAEGLFKHLLNPNDQNKLSVGLLEKLRSTVKDSVEKKDNNTLQAIDYRDQNKQQLYLRSIQSQIDLVTKPTIFHLLLVLDETREQNELNPDLIARYQLTEKEQMVLRQLIHGKSIKDIAKDTFISENTVKTHMKSLFRKTDTKSQAAVVRLILTHESQILDLYFGAGGGGLANTDISGKDKEVVLSDGNKVVYREYGPKQGRPLIVFHNGFGCRLAAPTTVREACERTNRRIIIPDRPGFGKTPYIDKHPEKWPDRLSEFIDLLDIQDYDVLGNVLGCPMAINFAMQADSKLRKLILSCPVVVNNKQDTKYLLGIFSPASRLVRASKRFALEIYQLWLKSVTLNLDTHYRSMLIKSFGSAEQSLFAGNGTIELMVSNFKEGASMGLNGISNEMVYCLSPLKHKLSRLTIPVELWHGSEDDRISLEGVKAIYKDLPNHTLHTREGYSEHMYYALFEEIIA